MKFSIEVIMQIWNDDTGERVEIGQDSDGLDLVEIRQRGSDDKIVDRITMPREQAILLHAALGDYLASMLPES